ncbi:MAG: CAP domain-containing protein [Bacteroidota bacterium]
MNNHFFFFLLLFSACSACTSDIQTGEDPVVVIEEPTPDIPTPNPTNNDVAVSEMAQSVMDLVNQWRTNGCRCGNQNMPPVSALTFHNDLMEAAQSHSQDQASMNRMQHAGSDGSNVGQRVTRSGYTWRAVAENVAWNYQTAESVVNGWINSEGHCRNIMNSNYRHMGIAQQNWFWTQVFAAPR